MYSQLQTKLTSSNLASMDQSNVELSNDSGVISHAVLYAANILIPSGTTHSVTIDDIAAGSTFYGVVVENADTTNKVLVGATDSNGAFIKSLSCNGSGEFNVLTLSDLDTSVALTVVCAAAADCSVKIRILCS